MQGISVCWFYILQLYYIHWLALVIFWWSLRGFLCRGSCHLQTMRVLLLLFQFGFLLFIFPLWLLWPKLPKLRWIVVVKVGTLVLFLTLGEMLSIFQVDFYTWCKVRVEICGFYMWLSNFFNCPAQFSKKSFFFHPITLVSLSKFSWLYYGLSRWCQW